MAVLSLLAQGSGIFSAVLQNIWSLLCFYSSIVFGWSTLQQHKSNSNLKTPMFLPLLAPQSAISRTLTIVPEESSEALYPPLIDPHAVRLVTIYERDVRGYIKCVLKTVRLVPDAYIALSHVWGVEHESCKILVNGKSIWIQPNLFSFLSFVADGCAGEMLGKDIWIDALCINQSDTQEKQQQIPKMGLIFSQAMQVVSWLHGPSLYHASDPNGPQSLTRALHVDTVHIDDVVLGNIIRLAEHEYWSRLWIVQELYLAKQVYIFWQGQVIFWPQLQNLILKSLKNGKPSVWRHPTLIDEKHIGQVRKSVKPFLTLIHHCFESRCHVAETRSLKGLIVQYKSQSCLELYDRVFALMALSPERNFIPRYDMPAMSLLAHIMLGSIMLPDLESVSEIGKILLIDPEKKLGIHYLGVAGSGIHARWYNQALVDKGRPGLHICTRCEDFDKLHIANLPDTDYFFAYSDKGESASPVVELEYVARLEYCSTDNHTQKILHFNVPYHELVSRGRMQRVLFEYKKHHADDVVLKQNWSGLCDLFKAWHISRHPSSHSRSIISPPSLHSGRRRTSSASCRYSIMKRTPD